MSEVITTASTIAKPGITVSPRENDYTGIFPSQKIKEMLNANEIRTVMNLDRDQVQPASIDLRLGDCAYPVRTSFLPGRNVKVLDKLKQLDNRFADFRIDLRNGAVLEKGLVYVIPLQESISLKSEVAAFAEARPKLQPVPAVVLRHDD